MRVEITIVAVLLVFAICITCKKVTESGPKKKASGGPGSSALKITDVLPDEIDKLIKDNEYLLVYFYDNVGGQSQLSKQVIFLEE